MSLPYAPVGTKTIQLKFITSHGVGAMHLKELLRLNVGDSGQISVFLAADMLTRPTNKHLALSAFNPSGIHRNILVIIAQNND